MSNNGNRARVEALTLQGWSASEIGRELGIATGTVYSHRHEARNRANDPMPETPVRLVGGRPGKKEARMCECKLRRAEWEVRNIPAKDAREFVVEHHYSKGCSNTRVYSHGLFRKDGADLYGVALWLPPTKVAAQSVNKEEWQKVLSLTRLACHPDAPKNAASFLMANSIRLIKEDGRFVSLVTYADVRMNHTGAIYRATNWDYVGEMRGSPAWIDPNTGRQVARKSTISRSKKEMEELGYECIGTFGKHKFVMHLHKR